MELALASDGPSIKTKWSDFTKCCHNYLFMMFYNTRFHSESVQSIFCLTFCCGWRQCWFRKKGSFSGRDWRTRWKVIRRIDRHYSTWLSSDLNNIILIAITWHFLQVYGCCLLLEHWWTLSWSAPTDFSWFNIQTIFVSIPPAISSSAPIAALCIFSSLPVSSSWVRSCILLRTSRLLSLSIANLTDNILTIDVLEPLSACLSVFSTDVCPQGLVFPWRWETSRHCADVFTSSPEWQPFSCFSCVTIREIPPWPWGPLDLFRGS